uniref:CTCK domain-containing protein n=1 Tax=Timema cristinae TaxID=61476 RepID=A0A7R9H1J3_TIMCR|nr:unnamed protein product [Timema cristinae]
MLFLPRVVTTADDDSNKVVRQLPATSARVVACNVYNAAVILEGYWWWDWISEWLANALVVLSSTAEDGEIEVRISLANAHVVLSSTAEDGEIEVRISLANALVVLSSTAEDGEIEVQISMYPRVQLPAVLFMALMVKVEGRNGGPPSSSTDSILDIINTKEVERFLAQRRENTSREERRFLQQNALEDAEATMHVEEDTQTREPTHRSKGNSHEGTLTPESRDDPLPRRNKILQTFQDGHTVGVDVLVKRYNDSFPYQYNDSFPYQSTDRLSDLSGYSGDKLLKSSKNALEVTRKEYLKRDWCKTEPLVQKVREDGCLTRTVINRFCYGQCNSFYIPKNPRRRRNRLRDNDEGKDGEIKEVAAAFKSCAFCKPKLASWITVTLHCPSLVPQLRRKRIQRIKQCKCITEVLN